MDLSRGDLNNNNSKGVSYSSGFFLLVGFAILGFVVSGFISVGILAAKSGAKVTEIQKLMSDPAYADTMKLIQVVSVVISMFIPPLAVAAILNRKPFRLLGFRKPSGSNLGLVIAIMVVSLAVVASLAVANKDLADSLGWQSWSEKLEKTYNEQVRAMLNLDSVGGYVLSLFIMALLPAICEEMLFRGGLQNFLSRAIGRPWISILIVSLIFSAIHFSFYGFLVRFFLGIVLGLIFEYSRNIWLSILGHFINNALAVTGVFLAMRKGNNLDQAMEKNLNVAYWGLLALPLLVYLFIELRKQSNRVITEHGV